MQEALRQTSLSRGNSLLEQRPWGRKELGTFEGQCSWIIVQEGVKGSDGLSAWA